MGPCGAGSPTPSVSYTEWPEGDPGVPKQKLRHGDWEMWEPTDIRESSRHTWEGQGTDPRSESLGAMAPDTFSNVKAGVN